MLMTRRHLSAICLMEVDRSNERTNGRCAPPEPVGVVGRGLKIDTESAVCGGPPPAAWVVSRSVPINRNTSF